MANRVVLLCLVAIFVSPTLAGRNFGGFDDGNRARTEAMPLVIDAPMSGGQSPGCDPSDFLCTHKTVIAISVSVGLLLSLLAVGAIVVKVFSVRRKKSLGQKNLETVVTGGAPTKESESGFFGNISDALYALEQIGKSLDLTEQGLFRKPGGVGVQQLLDKINNHEKIDYSQVLVDDKCGAIKEILRQFDILGAVDTNRTLETLEELHAVMESLPEGKALVLKWALDLSCDIAAHEKDNLMSPENVSFCVAPSLAPEKFSDSWYSTKDFFTSAIKLWTAKRQQSLPLRVFYY